MKTLRVFEHQTISAEQELTFYRGKISVWEKLNSKYIDALWKLYDKKKCPFFTPTRKGVCFKEYVGVVKVCDLIIEILPKADNRAVTSSNANEEERKWQSILIDMLRVCHLINTPTVSDAHLKIRSNSILDLYIARFINEVNDLLRQGLVKRYRKVERNSVALKGKLLVGKHIQKNIVHQERFYISQTQYDKNHILHKILLKAIRVLPGLCSEQTLLSECYKLQLNFPEVDDVKISEELFDKIHFDKKSDSYKLSVQIAKMLLLNYRPDLTTGSNHSIAILFNMNQLWEDYIFRVLKKNKPEDVDGIYNQKTINFWKTLGSTRRLKPDIIIKSKSQGNIVIDTKWKNIQNDLAKISVDDLRQMYAYHHYFEAKKCYLLYPGNNEPIQNGLFGKNYYFGAKEIEPKHCGVMIRKCWNDSPEEGTSFLNKKLAREIYQQLNIVDEIPE